MIHKYRVPAVVLLLLAMLTLFGCGAQTDTQMTIENTLAGSRIMHCTISKQEVQNKIAGGEPALDTLIELNCPPQLSWEKSSDNRNITYTFTLAFTGRSDYIQKAEALLGHSPTMVFAAPDTAFVQGLRLKEDFTSMDLLTWLNAAAIQQGLISDGSSIWNADSGTTVQYRGQSIHADNKIDVNQTEYLPIDKITITTDILADHSFQRTIVFQIPQSTYDTAKDNITAYMKKRIPTGGSGQWSNIVTGKIFTVAFSAKTADELARQTSLVLDSNNTALLADTSHSLLGNQHSFTEQLDFSSFSSGKTGKTFVDYIYHANATGIACAELSGGGKWTNASDYLNGADFSISGDMDVMQIRLTENPDYTMDDISVFMTQQQEGTFSRQIQFTFSEANGSKGAQKAKTYFEGLQASDTTVTAEKNVCILSLTGSAEKISAALTTLFGSDNRVELTANRSFQLYHSTTVKEYIDMERFKQDTGVSSAAIHYHFTAPDNIALLSQQTDDKDAKSLPVQGKGGSLDLSGRSTVTVLCSALNGWFVTALLGLGLLTIFIAAALLYSVFYLLRRRRVKVMNIPNTASSFILLKQRCPKCGAPLYAGMRFCTKCGTPIRNEKKTNQ